MTERYVCIHCHFYQPPRENPWLEEIEIQDSAYPYHDWNERITAECYAPNTASRILDGEGRILRIPNNLERISFNMGPTLLAWMAEKAPVIYPRIVEADQRSRERFSGHGSALAQAYNHMILPLANRRDKRTQVLWGIRDFEQRFGRFPEGMWLPETAVDLETLDVLTELGIRFTVLAPHQARRVRGLGRRSWRDVSGSRIDPTMPYLQRLPSGREIILFFYDGPVSQAVAFERLLDRGEDLAHRLLGAFSSQRTSPQLVHIATDGETYGHHHPRGDMALAYALHYVESNGLARLTNYGEFLERHPPTREVEILENSSWSCAHGVERWRQECGCSSGGYPGWNQAWRAPLREALDWLRDALSALFEEAAQGLLIDPWAARDDYIGVVLDHSDERIGAFLRQHAAKPLDEAERVTALKLLEMQRHAMLMFTSCGWFFDELSGIESVQVIQYAGRAIQLVQEVAPVPVEEPFLQRLDQAKSNIPDHRDGRLIYEKFVRPAMLGLVRVGAHYAISSLFEEYAGRDRIFCYEVDRLDFQLTEAGRAKLAVGRARILSKVTREKAILGFAVLHFGDHNLCGGVREFQGEGPYDAMCRDVMALFSRADFPETIRRIDSHFSGSTYSLGSLFRDDQRRVLDRITAVALAEAAAAYRQVYQNHLPLIRFLMSLGVPVPEGFEAAARFALNADLKEALSGPILDSHAARGLIQQAQELGVVLDALGLEFVLRRRLEGLVWEFRENPGDALALGRLNEAVGLALALPFEVNLRTIQNQYDQVRQAFLPAMRQRVEQGEARDWMQGFLDLARKLSFAVDDAGEPVEG